MYTEAAEEQLLGGKPDFVLDAIDNIDTKVALLAACYRRSIPVLSSAGAGEAPNYHCSVEGQKCKSPVTVFHKSKGYSCVHAATTCTSGT